MPVFQDNVRPQLVINLGFLDYPHLYTFSPLDPGVKFKPSFSWSGVFSGGVLPNGEVLYLVVTVRYLVVQVLNPVV